MLQRAYTCVQFLRSLGMEGNGFTLII